MKRRPVIYTPEAGQDLDWIYGIIAGAGSATTANRYDARLRAFCERLEYGSERGTVRDDILPGLRVIGFERSASVAFVAEADRVVIVGVFYGGVNWTRGLGGTDDGP